MKITNAKFLFDCDGVLVNSEPVAFVGCCDVMNQILSSKDVDYRYAPTTLQQEFAGLQAADIARALAQRHEFSLTPDEIDRVAIDEEEMVIAALLREVQATEGMVDVLEMLQLGAVPRAVVSSSSLARVHASLTKAELSGYFHPDHILSAKALPVPKGKPDPAVYLHAMQVLGSDHRRYVAIEDSPTGVEAAVRAGIPVIGYLGAHPSHFLAVTSSWKTLADPLAAKSACEVIGHWDEFQEAVDRLPD